MYDHGLIIKLAMVHFTPFNIHEMKKILTKNSLELFDIARRNCPPANLRHAQKNIQALLNSAEDLCAVYKKITHYTNNRLDKHTHRVLKTTKVLLDEQAKAVIDSFSGSARGTAQLLVFKIKMNYENILHESESYLLPSTTPTLR